jgi:putative FmdB family regulatory protein
VPRSARRWVRARTGGHATLRAPIIMGCLSQLQRLRHAALHATFGSPLTMPIYAYRCSACGHARDVLQKLSDPLLTTCDACGAQAFSKQLTAAGFQLKGSGWYVTDFRDGGGKDAKDKAGAADAAKGDAAKGDAAKADGSKPDATTTAAPAVAPGVASSPAPASAPSPSPAPAAAAPTPSSGGSTSAGSK